MEVSRQYDLFVEKYGSAPAYIDSHLHVHQFPGVREAVMSLAMRGPAESRPCVRNNGMPLSKIMRQGVSRWKSFFVCFFGRRVRDQLRARGIPTNRGFAGIYDYREWSRYPEFLDRFVSHMESETGILAAHPGLEEPWRRVEFEAIRDRLPAILSRRAESRSP